MKEDFLMLANSIKHRLEERFDQESLKGFYVYENLLKLIDEWEHQKFSSDETEIGIAGVKFFDSGSAEDNQLRSDIVKLDRLYSRRSQPNAPNLNDRVGLLK